MNTSKVEFCKRVAAVGLGAIVAAILSAGAWAQAWPSRPVTFLYPFGPGADVWLRAVASDMTKSLGQPVLVENRPGAGGRVGMTALMQGKPDGYLISMVTNTMVVHLPLLSPTFKIEPVKHYTPITQLFNLKLAIYATATVPFRDMKGLIEYGNANPGKLNFGSNGTGSLGHLGLELLSSKAGLKATHISYKGESDQVSAMLAGDLHLMITSGGPKAQVNAGRLQVLATTGDTRWKVYPDKPTALESGIDYVFMQWQGVVGPPGLPADIVDRLSVEIHRAMNSPGAIKLAEIAGTDTLSESTPRDLTALIRSELRGLEAFARQTGIVFE